MTGLERRVLDDQGEVLKPYVPRLLIEWVRDTPQATYRAVDGSLAFVDISGFTALTESLARRGKIGAELLRDTLDGVFRALLDEAYLWGAGLLKWGGDALLLLFDGAEHEQRAARAAWEMQRTIGRVGRIRVGSGTVTLRMSIGIASGAIDFFTAGSVHRELLVVGPTATETAVIEGGTDAGEIGISHALAARLDPSSVGSRKETGLLLAAPPDVEERPAPDVGWVSGPVIASCIPVAAREHVLLERSEPEHRTITAVFFDLMNTDVLLAELGPTAFVEALDERIGSIQDAAARYEVPFNVTDVSKGSVKVLLTAGAPSSTGHDEEQTLRLAREVMDRPGVVPMRAGINTGRVFTGDFGPPYRRTYAVLGDAINTAARLLARAEAGQILATEIVLERSRTTFETTPIDPFAAKGKAEPIRGSLVGPIVGRRQERIAETPFVGRERELAALRDVLDDVRTGTSWTVEIAGASGIGKTRLIQEALAATPELRVFHATCEEYEASTPYHALHDPLRELLGLERGSTPADSERRLRAAVAAADPELVPWMPLLGLLLGLDLPPTSETQALDERFLRETLADVTLRFLVAALGGTSVALVVEDAQFLDDSSADLLRRVSQADESLPHALVVARTEPKGLWTDVEEERRRFLAFDLLPLSERDAAQIVSITTDEQPFRPHEVEELARRSGGSPLFLVELLNVARAAGTTDVLPDSVEAVVTADIDRLAASDRIVLRYASVFGVAFEETLLAATLRDEVALDEALWERLRGLVDRDADGRLRFRNTLVHEAAYEGLSFRRRRELHGRVAEAIVGAPTSLEDEAATLALHFSAARRHAETWQYARLGGDRARAVAANVEAARLYELALASSRYVRDVGAGERADVLVALGMTGEIAGLFEQSYAAYRRASRLLADDPVARARVFALRTRVRIRMSPFSLALRETAAGLRLVERRTEAPAVALRARLRAMRSEILMYLGRPREAIRLAEISVEEAQRSDELEALTHAYTALDGSHQLLGEPEKAVNERKSLEIHVTLGHVRAAGITSFNLGVQAYADGRWGEAESRYLRAQEDLLRAGDRQTAAYVGSTLSELLIGRGTLDEAERVLTESRRVLRSSNLTAYAIFTDIQLARCAFERGDAPGALAALELVAAEAAAVGDTTFRLEAGIYLAHVNAKLGSPEAGLEALDSAAYAGEDAVLYEPALERARAACLSALGRTEEALAHLDLALAAAERQGMLYEQLLSRRARVDLRPRSEPGAEELHEIERLAQLLGVDSRAS